MPPDFVHRPSAPPPPRPHGGVPRFLGAGDFVYRSSPVPVFEDANASRLRDAEGRTYIDAEAANGSTALGYDAQLLEDAWARVARMPALPSFCESTLRLEVAEQLERHVSRSTGRDGRVTFEVGGAQGLELAMKVAAANVGWGQVVVFQGGYHGRSPFTAHLSASPRYRAHLGGSIGEVIRLPYPDREQSPFGLGAEDASEAARAYVESFGTERSGIREGDVAALVFEPILNVGGMARPDPTFVRATVEHFRGLGALVVVDEVFTGFHRTGPAHGFELYGIDPDIVVLSKALTNGAAALSAVWAREPLLGEACFAPGTHSSTLSGTPLALAIAGAVLRRFADRDAWTARLEALERRLGQLVDRLVGEFPDLVSSGYALGGIARLLLRVPIAPAVRQAALVSTAADVCGTSGILVASTGLAPDMIALHPALVISDEDLDLIEAHMVAAFQQLRTA